MLKVNANYVVPLSLIRIRQKFPKLLENISFDDNYMRSFDKKKKTTPNDKSTIVFFFSHKIDNCMGGHVCLGVETLTRQAS